MKKKKTKYIVTIFIIIFALLIVAEFAVLQNKKNLSDEQKKEDIVIMQTNDVRGGVNNYSKVKALKDEYQAQGKTVILLDAGGFLHGSSFVNFNKGENIIDIMNMCSYDACNLGNFEFIYGYDNLKKLKDKAKFSVISSNVLHKNKNAFLKDKIITTKTGIKIGISGICNPETSTYCNPNSIKDITFKGQKDYKEIYDLAKQEVKSLRLKGCDFVVLLSYLDINDREKENTIYSLLKEVPGIDLLVFGNVLMGSDNSKELLPEDRKIDDSYISWADDKLKEVGTVFIKDGKIKESSTVKLDGYEKEDKEIKDYIKNINDNIKKEYDKVIATADDTLHWDYNEVRREETSLSHLYSDAIMWKLKEENIKCDGVIINGGSINGPINKGNVKIRDVINAFPFSNNIVVMSIKGEKILEVLEASTFCTPSSVGGFPVVSGVEFTLNTKNKFEKGELYNNSTYYKPLKINRVTIDKIGDEEFDKDKVYKIATSDFLASGGDTFFGFCEVESQIITEYTTDGAALSYIEEGLNKRITKDKYLPFEKRIKIIK